ncbi:hypothetical protein GCM10028791_18640 [Echinicola sediminis]
MKSVFVLLLTVLTLYTHHSSAQSSSHGGDDLPFGDLTHHPENYSPGSVAARMVESLGFRFRYATQDLKETDFGFKVEADARTIGETMEHIYGLSTVIRAAVIEDSYGKKDKLSPMEARAEALLVLKEVYDRLLDMDEEALENLKIRGNHPFWVLINGPLVDAIWHSGQIATLRRANGNPMPKGVNVFLGKYEPEI